ncbi:MAG: TetR/AcrR family transcriptional regulator [Bacteroidetes bacterium]|nr:TetR/AcrR family transcriptional regulator [Bacteroidota bacterium]
MARIIDETKITRIKAATLEMVVARGYGGASISEIANLAGVAEGYLYRHYKGKAELVNDLLFSNLNELIILLESLLDNHHSVKEIFEKLTRVLFELANTDPDRIKFLYVLMHDYNFKIQEEQREKIISLCKRVKDIGLSTKELSPDIDEETIYLLGVAYPIQFINLHLKGFFNQSALAENEIKKVLYIHNQIIKK